VLLDEFCDRLWLEDGLAKNTLEAYRRDLRLFADWLASQGNSLLAASEPDVFGYLAFRHSHRTARARARARRRGSPRASSVSIATRSPRTWWPPIRPSGSMHRSARRDSRRP
jgi:site-specific recombinase XerC